MSIEQNFPSIRPSMFMDFASTKILPPTVTFTRASTATYYDGKSVSKAEENLLTYSQEFDNAAWIKNNTTVTANSIAAPDGTSTADTMLETVATGTHYVYQARTVIAGQHFFSVYIKDAGRAFAFVAVGTNAVVVDLTLGTVGAANGSTADRAIQSVGSGWYRVSFSVTTTAASTDFVVYASTDGVWANRSYAGDITKGIYLWGAQLEQR